MTKLSTNWVDSKMFIDLITDIAEADGALVGLDVCDVMCALKTGTQLLCINGNDISFLKGISKDVKVLLLFFRSSKETPLKDVIELTESIKSCVSEDVDIKLSFIFDETITKIGEIKVRTWAVA